MEKGINLVTGFWVWAPWESDGVVYLGRGEGSVGVRTEIQTSGSVRVGSRKWTTIKCWRETAGSCSCRHGYGSLIYFGALD